MLALPALLPLSDKQETIFGYAARIEVGKGPFVLADAVAQLRKTRNDMLVRVAGIGPAMQMVKARVRELGIDSGGLRVQIEQVPEPREQRHERGEE